MRMLVTGSSGFVGEHLMRVLCEAGHHPEGFDVATPTFRGADHMLGDITDAARVLEAVDGFDFVLHLAGLLGTHELVEAPMMAVHVNILGTLNVLEACRETGAKMILASKPNPWVNTYTITKKAAEEFVEMYRREHGVQAAVVRWFNVYGPGQRLQHEVGYKKLVPHAIVSALRDQPVEVYGYDGTQTIDLIHVRDAARAMMAMMENWHRCEGEVLDAGHYDRTVNWFLSKLALELGHGIDVEYSPMRKGEPNESDVRAFASKLKSLTGWRPRVRFRDGLASTVKWYRKRYL